MGLKEFLKVSHDNSVHMSLDKQDMWSCLMSSECISTFLSCTEKTYVTYLMSITVSPSGHKIGISIPFQHKI